MSDIYDGVFRTVINDCTQFILPFINEVFGEHYKGDEKIEFHPNEHFIDQLDEPDIRRITDSNFTVIGETTKKYHLECESSTYSSKVLIRLFEYDAQIALDESETGEDKIEVTFPNTAVLYLRSTKNTPDKMHVIINVPGGSVEYAVPIAKMATYSIDDIFEKKLYMLIPFYIFTFESDFELYDTNEEMLEKLKLEFKGILERLEELDTNGEIDSYEKRTIIELSDNVIDELTKKYENLQKGVGEIMGGALIETEARKLRNEGIEIGRTEGALDMLIKLVKQGILSLADGAKQANMTESLFEEKLKAYKM